MISKHAKIKLLITFHALEREHKLNAYLEIELYNGHCIRKSDIPSTYIGKKYNTVCLAWW